jgi:hypothetical protein
MLAVWIPRQDGKHGDRENEITRDAAEEALEHRVDLPRPAQSCDNPLVRLAGQPQADEQDHNRADDVQRVSSGPEMSRQSSGVASNTPNKSCAWREPGPMAASSRSAATRCPMAGLC